MYGLVHCNQLYIATMASVWRLTRMWQIGNLYIQNLLLLKSVAPMRLLITMGYNASVGIDTSVKLQGLWFWFEVSHA